TVESLEPLPGTVDPKAQTLKIARSEDFIATVSPSLGYRDTALSGLVIRDYGYTPVAGTARLQEMQNDAKRGQVESGWEVPTTITRVRTMPLKEARERIKAGRDQYEAAVALGLNSVSDLRTALAAGRIRESKVEKAGLKSLAALRKLMEAESFTPDDATHYGYASLTDMRSKLTALFVDQDLEAGRTDNLIHFVDIAPPDKSKMCWHRPARRATVSFSGDGDAPPEGTGTAPDPKRVRGAPDVQREPRTKPKERGT
ncbi:MAG: hypothetical protein EBV03_10750, partial [Proteobacteria bacterium]|nr:hypothetical protein [Pseudomonadota bacterium]